MKTYHKINSLYQRDPKTHKFLPELSNKEVAVIGGWIGEEKIDGTNIRIAYDPAKKKILFGGRTDAAQIPTGLFTYLQEKFTVKLFEQMGVSKGITLYGEGVGKKIQTDSDKYLPEGQDYGFILFDVVINDIYLAVDEVAGVAKTLGIVKAPIVAIGSLEDMEKMVKVGFTSPLAGTKKMAEGLVMKPPVPVFDRNGDRIITKLKYADFHK